MIFPFYAVLFYSVQWRREDGKDIVIRNEGRDKQRNEFNYFNIMAIHLSFCFLIFLILIQLTN